ncbi:MAG: hypothetical protein GZ091_06025 [Paludibacter sp.]|nr:hypothetical protein [Paludibacter sp.]
MQPILNEVVRRFKAELDDEQQIAFKSEIKSFVRLYRFLSQIITFTDVSLEKYYVFLTDLYKKLPFNKNILPTEVLEEIDLDSYKLQHQFTTELPLVSQNSAMKGMNPGAGGKGDDEYEWLTNIIKVLNDTFGVDLKDEDKLDFERMKNNIYGNEDLMSFFNAKNTRDNIQDKFNEEIDSELLNFINTKLDLYNKLSEDKINLMFKRLWFNDIYDKRVRNIG